MGPWLVGFLLGIGGGTWAWNKSMKETNRQDTSIIIGAVVGIVIFLVIGTLSFLVHF